MTYAWIYQDLQSCITSALQSIQSKQLWAQWRHLFSSPPVWQEASNLVQTAVSYFSSAAPLNPPPIPSFSLSSISTPSIQTSSPPPLCMGAAEPTWYPDFIHTHTQTHSQMHTQEGWRNRDHIWLVFTSPGCWRWFDWLVPCTHNTPPPKMCSSSHTVYSVVVAQMMNSGIQLFSCVHILI